MTENQRKLAALQVEQSEKRERANALLSQESRTDAETTELDEVTKRLQAIEPELRACLVLAQSEDDAATETETHGLDAETRERLELRAKSSVTRYVEAAMRGRVVNGPEAEYMAACGVDGIPLELFEPDPREQRDNGEQRADAVTGAPGTVGVNLQPIRPAIFAGSIAPRLGIDMPRVASGTYAEARISTNLTAGAKAKGAAAEATEAAFAVSTATPKRVSGRLGIRIEDVASVGVSNFEASLRANLQMVMSNELDGQMINGDGADANLSGMFKALADAADPADVATFDAFVGSFAGAVDGLWASRVSDVGIVCGPDTYALSAKTFRDAAGQDLGAVAFSDYAAGKYGGWWTNARMPDAANSIQAGILRRKGRTGIRTAVCPHWGALSIDDVYTGSASGTRFVSFHVLLGDVLIIQPGAYAEVRYKLA